MMILEYMSIKLFVLKLYLIVLNSTLIIKCIQLLVKSLIYLISFVNIDKRLNLT